MWTRLTQPAIAFLPLPRYRIPSPSLTVTSELLQIPSFRALRSYVRSEALGLLSVAVHVHKLPVTQPLSISPLVYPHILLPVPRRHCFLQLSQT